MIIMNFAEILKKSGVPFDANGKIIIPPWVKHIKLDIGMCFHAPHTQQWIEADPTVLVFGFEANPEAVNLLCSPFNKQGDPSQIMFEFRHLNTRAYVIPVALGKERCESMKFYVTDGFGGNSSFFPPSDLENRFAVKEIINVPVYPLSEFFELLPDTLAYVDFIKIDAQGADLDILKGAGDWLTKKVVFVTAEAEVGPYYVGATGNYHTCVEYMTQKQNFSHIRHPHTEDPTFINNTLLRFADEVTIFQRG